MKRTQPESATNQGEEQNVNQIAAVVLRAILVTLVTTLASVAVEEIRRYNEDRNEDGWQQPYDGDYDRW